MARPKHTIVLAVNIDSPRKAYVTMGNITMPTLEPMNLADQTDCIESAAVVQA